MNCDKKYMIPYTMLEHERISVYLGDVLQQTATSSMIEANPSPPLFENREKKKKKKEEMKKSRKKARTKGGKLIKGGKGKKKKGGKQKRRRE